MMKMDEKTMEKRDYLKENNIKEQEHFEMGNYISMQHTANQNFEKWDRMTRDDWRRDLQEDGRMTPQEIEEWLDSHEM